MPTDPPGSPSAASSARPGASGPPATTEADEHADRTGSASHPQRHETRTERADRNLSELVQELRVAQTGVQILFAFLLSLPFLADFPHAPPFEGVLTGALLTAAGATICFIAPVAFHRSLFRRGMKEGIVAMAHRIAVVGLVLLALAMALSTWLVLATLWAETTATTVVAIMLVGIAVLWLVPPRLLDGHRAEGGRVPRH